MSVQQNADPEFEVAPWPGDGLRKPDEQSIALVVDDEPLVRQLICSVLSRLGWRSLEAADSTEALLLGTEIDIGLLITDHEIPGIKGIEVADVFRGRVPDLPVVVVSGTEAVGQVASSRGYRFLAKPFGPGELSSLVTGLVARPTGDSDGRGAVTREIPRPRQKTRIGYAAARAPGQAWPFSGWKPRPTAGDDADRAIGTRTCTLRCFPTEDPQFEADANKILAECTRTRTWASVLEQVRLRIVQIYPRATVHPRSLLAANGDPNEYWYCYRDGGLLLPRMDS